jgi:hypothetical protein
VRALTDDRPTVVPAWALAVVGGEDVRLVAKRGHLGLEGADLGCEGADSTEHVV